MSNSETVYDAIDHVIEYRGVCGDSLENLNDIVNILVKKSVEAGQRWQPSGGLNTSYNRDTGETVFYQAMVLVENLLI